MHWLYEWIATIGMVAGRRRRACTTRVQLGPACAGVHVVRLHDRWTRSTFLCLRERESTFLCVALEGCAVCVTALRKKLGSGEGLEANFAWTGLDWTGLDWTGLDCTGLDKRSELRLCLTGN